MDYLKNDPLLRSADIRNSLDVSASTMTSLFKKCETQFAEGGGRSGAVRKLEPREVRKLVAERGFVYPQKARIMSFMICKGGTGKSSSTYWISQRLASYGAKVLVIDADPQGNCTRAFQLDECGFDIGHETPVLVDVFSGESSLSEAILKVSPSIHLLPSTPMNSTLDSKIRDNFKNVSIALKKVISPCLTSYDYILIDCAPALNLTNTAMVSASDSVILPVNPDEFSKMGLNQTLTEIETIESDFSLDIETRIVFTRFDAREMTSLKYLSDILSERKDVMYKTVIRTSADIKNAITKNEDLFSYRKSTAREDYDSLTREIMGFDSITKKKSHKKN